MREMREMDDRRAVRRKRNRRVRVQRKWIRARVQARRRELSTLGQPD